MNNRTEGNEGGEILRELPLIITSVTPQKKRKDRYSLFHESRFLLGVSAQTLTDFSLGKGVELTPFLYRKIKESEEYQAVKDRCYLLLSGRDHTGHELQQKIVRKGFAPETARKVVEEFSEKGLLNDRQFAEKFVSDKTGLKKWGPVKVKTELIKKGVNRKTADEVIEKLTGGLEQSEICVDLALKRRKNFLREEDPFKRKQKIYRYLAGRGYHSDQITKALPTILKSLNA